MTEEEEHLYTVIFLFQGGTYVSQVNAIDALQARTRWGSQLDVNVVKGMGQKMKNYLIQYIEQDSMADESISRLYTTSNVWTFCMLLHGKFGCVYIVKTAQ